MAEVVGPGPGPGATATVTVLVERVVPPPKLDQESYEASIPVSTPAGSLLLIDPYYMSYFYLWKLVEFFIVLRFLKFPVVSSYGPISIYCAAHYVNLLNMETHIF